MMHICINLVRNLSRFSGRDVDRIHGKAILGLPLMKPRRNSFLCMSIWLTEVSDYLALDREFIF